jgi:hypothetical protein
MLSITFIGIGDEVVLAKFLLINRTVSMILRMGAAIMATTVTINIRPNVAISLDVLDAINISVKAITR